MVHGFLQAPPPVAGGAASDLREAVIAWLGVLAPLEGLVGNRVYYEEPSQLSSYPCVAVEVTEREFGKNLAGADGSSRALVEIRSLAQLKSQSVAISKVVYDYFFGFRGVQDGVPVLSNYYEDEADQVSQPIDGSDMWIYHTVLSYRVKHRVPVPANITQTNC